MSYCLPERKLVWLVTFKTSLHLLSVHLLATRAQACTGLWWVEGKFSGDVHYEDGYISTSCDLLYVQEMVLCILKIAQTVRQVKNCQLLGVLI